MTYWNFQELKRNLSGCRRRERVCQIARGLQIMSRPTILTQPVLARVASLVDNGRSAAEIASEIGCTLGTLRVRCSQHGISLRRRATGESAATTIDLGAWPNRMPLQGANLLTESMRSTRAEQLLANHQLRSALNSKFSCRKLPPSNSD